MTTLSLCMRGTRALATLMAATTLAAPTISVSATPQSIVSQNAGTIPDDATLPFKIRRVATFDSPWAIAFLPGGRMLVTEKPGKIFITTQSGAKTGIQGIPKVYYQGQDGLLDIALSPDFAHSGMVYFTFVAPAREGGVLTLARARLEESGGQARLRDLTTLWRQEPPSRGGQPGGIITFTPDGRHLFLTVGDRQEPETAQDPDSARGKILRMNPDGSAPADNPMAGQKGIRALTWSTGHRNPYGLAFAPDGQLWEDEMGPRGGDELNLILRGRNYGWPLVSNGDNYDGVPIPRHSTRPDLEAPRVYWTPVIAPAGLAFYEGAMFPAWRGSALIGGLVSRGLVRIVFSADGNARQSNRWSLGARIRDVVVAPDGAVWVIEDGPGAGLLRLTPK